MDGNRKKIWNTLKTATAVLLLTVFALLTVLGILSGAKTDMVSSLPFAVLEVTSDSMYPKICAGDGIIEIRKDYDALKAGDIITIFQDGELVTHEIVSRDGASITTRGIANGYDDAPITAESYSGKVAMVLPGFSVFLQMTQGWKKAVWILAILLILFAPEVVFKWTEKKRKQKRIMDH